MALDILYNLKYQETIRGPEFNNGKGWITIFTPTYNRANFLYRPYNSFRNQINQHFVWLLVNDGSQDATKQEAQKLLDKEEIPILFISKQNGGKHSAFKEALEHTITEFFVCADDDDKYYPNATQFFLQEWSVIKEKDIGAIRALTIYNNGNCAANFDFKVVPTGFHIDMSTLDMIYKEKKLMENWTCYKVDALRSVSLFPPIDFCGYRHLFVSEIIWQSRFARKYKCRFLFTPLREYFLDSGESLSRRKETKQRYVDDFLNSFYFFNENIDYLIKYTTLGKCFKEAVKISVMRYRLQIPFRKFFDKIESIPLKCLFILLAPVGRFTSRCCVPEN